MTIPCYYFSRKKPEYKGWMRYDGSLLLFHKEKYQNSKTGRDREKGEKL